MSGLGGSARPPSATAGGERRVTFSSEPPNSRSPVPARESKQMQARADEERATRRPRSGAYAMGRQSSAAVATARLGGGTVARSAASAAARAAAAAPSSSSDSMEVSPSPISVLLSPPAPPHDALHVLRPKALDSQVQTPTRELSTAPRTTRAPEPRPRISAP
jgi:hypothetical protein